MKADLPKTREISKVGPVIGKLISLGAAITFWRRNSGTLYFWLVMENFILFASLIIVTGPTIANFEKYSVKKDVSAVLKWEGILIDPIGALVAVLIFEFISVVEM